MARAPLEKSKSSVKKAANLFPVRKTLVAPILPDPIFRKSPSPSNFAIRIPNGIEPRRYPNAHDINKMSIVLVKSGSIVNLQK